MTKTGCRGKPRTCTKNSMGIWSEDWEGREEELAEFKMSEEGRQELCMLDYSQFDEPDDCCEDWGMQDESTDEEEPYPYGGDY